MTLFKKFHLTIGCKASYMLDFQVLVLKEVMNSLFEYVFLTNSYARLVLFVYIYLTREYHQHCIIFPSNFGKTPENFI